MMNQYSKCLEKHFFKMLFFFGILLSNNAAFASSNNSMATTNLQPSFNVLNTDTDGDGVYNNTDIDDDNDGILDSTERLPEQTDSYSKSSADDGGSTHTYSYTYSDNTEVSIDLYLIDDAFNVEIEGTKILSNGKNLELEAISSATGARLVFSDNTPVGQPWLSNLNGLPRVKVLIDNTGLVTIYGTRTIFSSVFEELHTNEGSTYNTLYFPEVLKKYM